MAATLKVTRSRVVKGLYEPYQALSSASMSNGTVNFAGELKYQTGKSLKQANRLSSDFLSSLTVRQASMITAEAIDPLQ